MIVILSKLEKSFHTLPTLLNLPLLFATSPLTTLPATSISFIFFLGLGAQKDKRFFNGLEKKKGVKDNFVKIKNGKLIIIHKVGNDAH